VEEEQARGSVSIRFPAREGMVGTALRPGGGGSFGRLELEEDDGVRLGRAGWASELVGQFSAKMKRKSKQKWLGCQGYLGRNRFWAAERNINCFFEFWVKELEFKSIVLNVSKSNLNWIQNRIKSNQLFGNFSNLKIW
jgi:hypothetical protein